MKLYDFGMVLFLAVAGCITLSAFLVQEKDRNEELREELQKCHEECDYYYDMLEGGA